METRLDRIEKAIEAMLLGISELRESQKKTDSQILELRESQKKTDEQMRRTDAKLDRVGRQLADRYAEKAGLYVMTQTDEGGAALLNRDDFKPKEFS
jgi:septal ring factor EnvC (AmiA/AmiB activator)